MTDSQEPHDGDFVAYVERLQRESAARLSRASAPVPIDTGQRAATASTAHKAASGQFAAPAEPALSKAQVEQLMTRLAASRPAARAVGGAIALAAGAFLFLLWLASDRNGILLVFAVGLALWGLSRLRASLKELSSSDRRLGRDLVVRWFGPAKRR